MEHTTIHQSREKLYAGGYTRRLARRRRLGLTISWAVLLAWTLAAAIYQNWGW